MLYFASNINTITVYGVGSGNAPARVFRVGHLWAVSLFLTKYYAKHFQRSQTCDKYGRIIV